MLRDHRTALSSASALVLASLMLGYYLSVPRTTLAQSDGTAPLPATSSAAAPAESAVRPTSTGLPAAATSSPALPRPSAPRPAPAAAPAPAPAASPAVATVTAPIPQEENAGASPLPVAVAAVALLLGGYAAVKKMRSRGRDSEKEESGRCFDIKKILDRKLEEVTDLKGKIEAVAEGKVRAGVRAAAEGTAARDLIAAAELAEKEYGRLKKLYEECIAEVGTTHRIKAIAFDVGGVIALNSAGNPNEAIARTLGVPVEEYMRAYFAHNHLSNVEGMSWEDMVMRVVGTFHPRPEIEKRIRDLIAERDEAAYLNRELITWFPLLRKAGYKVGILSNATAGLRPWLVEQKILEHVDATVISGEIGHQKPHQEAFQALFDGLGLSPGEVVFIDDSRKSLEKAKGIGYMPILFKGNAELIEELERAGVPMRGIVAEKAGGRV